MHRISVIGLATLFSLAGAAAMAQSSSTPAKSAAKPVVVAKATKSTASHQQLKSQAKGLALGQETAQAVSANQLDIANRVLTGKADCEFDQSVNVDAMKGQPGHFKVAFKNTSYTMVPEETTTGAVRLQDRKAGVVWLQIANKSMLMNSKIGQRMVDSCMHAEQRAAVEAMKGAARTSTLQ